MLTVIVQLKKRQIISEFWRNDNLLYSSKLNSSASQLKTLQCATRQLGIAAQGATFIWRATNNNMSRCYFGAQGYSFTLWNAYFFLFKLDKFQKNCKQKEQTTGRTLMLWKLTCLTSQSRVAIFSKVIESWKWMIDVIRLLSLCRACYMIIILLFITPWLMIFQLWCHV